MAEAKIKIDGIEYEMPTSYKLGEARVFKRLTGRALDEFENISMADPDLIVFLVWVAMHRADPKLKVEQVEELDFDQIDWTDEEDELPGLSALAVKRRIARYRRQWRERFGGLELGDDPRAFWQPFLADRMHWQPWDMEEITTVELMAAFDYVLKVEN